MFVVAAMSGMDIGDAEAAVPPMVSVSPRMRPVPRPGHHGMLRVSGLRWGVRLTAFSVPMMRAHMDSMMWMSPGQMSAIMATHDRMMSQMMDRMGSDMRGMHMSGDAKWNALMDSVKADLAELPGLQGGELASHMKAHAARLERLIAMHEAMMKGI